MNTQTKIRVEIEAAPVYWNTYLINNDHSGLSDEEMAQADRFVEWLDGGRVVSTEGEKYFVNRCMHVGYLGCTVIDYVIHYLER